jgi:2,5-diketo-D-gluconate reductase A
VGKALRDSGVPRDEVFITTKFYPGHKDPVAEAQRSLRRLGVDQVNLYLVHWPQGGATWAWPGMERARELRYAHSVGVSNFSVNQLDEVITAGTIQPAVNQVQFSAPEYRRGLLDACRQRGVALEAYSPLGTGRHLSNETVRRVAKRVGRAPAQVLLRWCLQRAVPVITKSTNRERIGENAQIFDFALSSEDLAELDALDQTNGTDLALEVTQRGVAADDPLNTFFPALCRGAAVRAGWASGPDLVAVDVVAAVGESRIGARAAAVCRGPEGWDRVGPGHQLGGAVAAAAGR